MASYRIRLDPWTAEFEGPVQLGDEEPAGRVDLSVETRTWGAVQPGAAPLPRRAAFVDGVRRVELRLLIEDGPRTIFGLLGSFGVGAVEVGERAVVSHDDVGRVAIAGGGLAIEPLEVAVGGRLVRFAPQTVPENTPVAPLDGLQAAMRRSEAALAERLAPERDVVFLDGPLSYVTQAHGPLVGFVKRLLQSYLEPEAACACSAVSKSGSARPSSSSKDARARATPGTCGWRGDVRWTPRSRGSCGSRPRAPSISRASPPSPTLRALLPALRVRSRARSPRPPEPLPDRRPRGAAAAPAGRPAAPASGHRGARPRRGDGMTTPVGRVLGTLDAMPLEFWVGVEPGEFLQLDDVVDVETPLPDGDTVRLFGVVDIVRARHEGAKFDSDVFLIEKGVLPAQVSQAAHVRVTRVEPEIFVPPLPGQPVRRAQGVRSGEALFFDAMERRLPIGLSRDGEPVFANLDFLDGTRGAHVNISGISGVATKTSYATFLLQSLFRSGALAGEAASTHAIVFNVKGEDLLFLDQRNERLKRRRPVVLPEARPARRGVRQRADPRPRPAQLTGAPARHGQPAGGRLRLLLDAARGGGGAAAALPVRGRRRRDEPARVRGGPDRGEAPHRPPARETRRTRGSRSRGAGSRPSRRSWSCSRSARPTIVRSPRSGRIRRPRARWPRSSGGCTPPPATWGTSSGAATWAGARLTCSIGSGGR